MMVAQLKIPMKMCDERSKMDLATVVGKVDECNKTWWCPDRGFV